MSGPVLTPELLRAYRETRFAATTPRGALTIRVGGSCTELDALCNEFSASSWTFITAWNPRSLPLPRSENDVRNDALLAALTSIGARVFGGEGIGADPTWPPERSFLALGVDRATALELGRRFEQFAVVWGQRGGAAELLTCGEAAPLRAG